MGAGAMQAIILAMYAWPMFCESETMHNVWHFVEYVGNTLLFMLSGMIIGTTMTDTDKIEPMDYLLLLLLWALMVLIRGIMLVCFKPLLGAQVRPSWFLPPEHADTHTRTAVAAGSGREPSAAALPIDTPRHNTRVCFAPLVRTSALDAPRCGCR